MAGLSGSNTIYKSLRPKQILKSEKKVTKVTEAVENEYIYPFGLHVEKNGLANICSGISLTEKIKGKVLNLPKKGKGLAEELNKDSLLSPSIKFRNAKSFKNIYKKQLKKF